MPGPRKEKRRGEKKARPEGFQRREAARDREQPSSSGERLGFLADGVEGAVDSADSRGLGHRASSLSGGKRGSDELADAVKRTVAAFEERREVGVDDAPRKRGSVTAFLPASSPTVDIRPVSSRQSKHVDPFSRKQD